MAGFLKKLLIPLNKLGQKNPAAKSAYSGKLQTLSEEDEEYLENFYKETIKNYTKKAYVLDTHNINKKGFHTGSRLGGVPYIGKDDSIIHKALKWNMQFIAQVNLSELSTRTELPSSGILSFWGEEPVQYDHMCTVIYFPDVDRKQTAKDITTKYPEFTKMHYNQYHVNSEDYWFDEVDDEFMYSGYKLNFKWKTTTIDNYSAFSSITDMWIQNELSELASRYQAFPILTKLEDLHDDYKKTISDFDVENHMLGYLSFSQDVGMFDYEVNANLTDEKSSTILLELSQLSFGPGNKCEFGRFLRGGYVYWYVKTAALKRKDFKDAGGEYAPD